MSRFQELLAADISGFTRLTAEQVEALENHYALLERWNRKLNLTAVRSFEEAVRVHYAESIFFATVAGEAGRVVDVGSGGGFPGVPYAVTWPGSRVTLVESHGRKAVFLRESTRGHQNIEVQSVRFDQITKNFDLLISRAVAWQDIAGHAAACARRVSLLVSEADAIRVTADGRIRWDAPTALPWPGRGFVLQGST